MTGEAEIRRPLMSGHCAFMGRESENGRASHARCAGGQRANPEKTFQPCPCPCHFPEPDDMELYECGSCGQVIIEAPRWPLDEDEDTRYTHMDLILNDDGEVVGGSGRALGEECGGTVSRNVESKSTERDCSRCGSEFTPKGRERICPDCKAAEVAETVDEFEALMADLEDDDGGDDDDFADLDDLDFED